MEHTKTLLIDMDAIVADLATEWYARWNAKGIGKPLTVEDVHKWNVSKITGDGRIYDVLREPGIYLTLKPFPAAQEVIKALGERKLDNGKPAFNIFFVTAAITSPNILSDKARWMEEHFPFINPRQMVYAYHKELVRGDFFIDDSPKNLKRFREAQPGAKLITIDYPYNQYAEVDLRARDYRDMGKAWNAIRNYLEIMSIFKEEHQF